MRPTKKTPETIAKLEAAFSLGSTITGACFHAGIGESTYHDWAGEDPGFSERMQALREKPILKALETVTSQLDEPKMAQWYLERRHPEYKNRQDIHHTGGAKKKPLEVVVRDYDPEIDGPPHEHYSDSEEKPAGID